MEDDRLERQIINWQKFCSLEYLRYQSSSITSALMSGVESAAAKAARKAEANQNKIVNEIGKELTAQLANNDNLNALENKLEVMRTRMAEKEEKVAFLFYHPNALNHHLLPLENTTKRGIDVRTVSLSDKG